jgi:hypothetical protein
LIGKFQIFLARNFGGVVRLMAEIYLSTPERNRIGGPEKKYIIG